MWFTLLVPLLTKIFGETGIIGQYIQTKAKINQTALDNKLQLEIATLEYNKQQGINAVESEKNKLAATPFWFKLISYIILNYPIVLAYCSAEKGRVLFENIGVIPKWYAMLYVAVVGVIWGLPVAANWMGEVFKGMQDFWSNRQDKKIEKILAVGEANTTTVDQAIKLAYDIQRKLSPNGQLSSSDVDRLRPIIEQSVKDNHNG